MMLTISTSHRPATDLGYLLHKHPDRVFARDVPYGRACVCFPEAGEDRCTAALIVDIDPVRLVRGRHTAHRSAPLDQYVNDRPYVASSFLSTAIGAVFRSAMTGRSEDRPLLTEQAIPLELRLPAVPCRGGESVLRALFEPLGYAVDATPIPLDETFPEWGLSRYLAVTLSTTARLQDVLQQLFVLLPVLDDDKHYWVGRSEIDKLLSRGGAWLVAHPARELITRRYLRYDRVLTRDALARLVEADDSTADADADAAAHDDAEAAIERPVRLNDQRIDAVIAALRDHGARRVADLGCGQGNLLRALLRQPWVEHVDGVDVSWRALEVAARRLRLDEMAPRQRARVDLRQGALTLP